MKRVSVGVERLAYSPQEVAQALGVGMTKINELLRSGQIDAVKHGGRVLVPAESVRKFLASLPKAAKSAA